MNYNTYLNGSKSIQNPIPGRSHEMKQNLAGGYTFVANDLTAIRRWLLTGSMTNAYYQTAKTMTNDNINLLMKLVNSNPSKVAEEIVYASKHGTRNSQSTCLLALVYLSTGNAEAKIQFRKIFNEVVRTASFLYEFLSYAKNIRGMGSVIHKAIKNWIESKNENSLEYQFLKYQQREGWGARDVLRLIKPVPRNNYEDNLYAWVAGKAKEYNGLSLIPVYERLKKGDISEKEVINLIIDNNLTHEMIPANIERTKGVWSALFQRMPVEASIRNLGNLTAKGVFTNLANLDLLESRLSEEALKKNYIHPLAIATALKTYTHKNSLSKSNLTWNEIPRVSDILESAINKSFYLGNPTNKVIMHALDVSGSMKGGTVGNLPFNPMEIEAIIALTTIKSEKNYYVTGFSDELIDMSERLNKNTSYRDITSGRIFSELRFGGTDASLVYNYARTNKVFIDTFVSWTDNESWIGDHPSEAFKAYKKAVNPNARAIYITLAAYSDYITLVDPNDKSSYDFAGFSSDTPKIIQMITEGTI